MRPCLLPALLMMTAAPALSDEVADTLQGAMEAYAAGDIGQTLQELAIAQQLLQGMRTESLAGFLPPAPEGWTLEIDTEMSAGLAMMGGGTGTEATYAGEDERFTLTIVADSPMVAAMAGLFSNPTLLSTAGKLIRVGRQTYLDQDAELTTVLDNRILIQASGADSRTMLPFLEAIDHDALAGFGS